MWLRLCGHTILLLHKDLISGHDNCGSVKTNKLSFSKFSFNRDIHFFLHLMGTSTFDYWAVYFYTTIIDGPDFETELFSTSRTKSCVAIFFLVIFQYVFCLQGIKIKYTAMGTAWLWSTLMNYTHLPCLVSKSFKYLRSSSNHILYKPLYIWLKIYQDFKRWSRPSQLNRANPIHIAVRYYCC